MTPLRIATFNMENLFNRYVFLDDPGERYETRLLPSGVTGIESGGEAACQATTLLQRNNTASAVLDCRPDILAVQEVENLWTLRSFNDEYLDGYFDRLIMIEGNDGRGIDVGLCIKYGCPVDVVGIRSHADDLTRDAREKKERINRYFDHQKKQLVVTNALFSRDCLEVDIDVGPRKARWTFLVNHLKSQSGGGDKLRTQQADRVAAIARDVAARGRKPIVIGDLNSERKSLSLKPLFNLVDEGTLADPFDGVADDWTYYYVVGHEASRIDYVLLDRSIAGCVVEKQIVRKGITKKCPLGGDRYPTVGYEGTDASSHCPVVVTLDLDRVA